MRVLLTSLPIRSHLLPAVVPLAEALTANGHEAVIATGPAMARHLEHAVAMPDIPAPQDFGPPPPWIPERDGVLDAPEVVATFGTNAGLLLNGSNLLHIVAEALGRLPVRAILAIGKGDWQSPRPANVELAAEVPQQRLLNTAKVFVTHEGYSSVREALTAAVPMVAVPLFADQPRNAARIEELKAGVRVDVKGLTADVLAEKIIHVLAAQPYHGAAETLAEEMAELPVIGMVPDDLVSAV